MSENTIIAIVNEKGGTGKTTTAVNLSAALGELGQKVLLVDLDGQAASSRWLGVEEDDRLAEALRRGGGLEPMRDVLPNVSLAPASGKLDSVAHDLRPTQGGQLRKVLAEAGGFDFVLIDCPPSLGNRLIGNALLAATHVIVPVETSILALDGLKILLTTLDDVRDGFDHEVVLGGVVACRYDGRTRLSPLVLTELKRALPGKVFNTVIRENVKMRECPASGQSILSFATESHAAEDYRALAREMLDEPEKWRLPAPYVVALPGEAPQPQAFAVDDLRSLASARVREATRKPSTRNEDTQGPELANPIGEAESLHPAISPSEAAVPVTDAPAEQARPQPSVPAGWVAPEQPSQPTADVTAPAEPAIPADVASNAVQLDAWLDNVEQQSNTRDGELVLNDAEAEANAPDAFFARGLGEGVQSSQPAAIDQAPEPKPERDEPAAFAPTVSEQAAEPAPLAHEDAAPTLAAQPEHEITEPAQQPSPFATDDEASIAGGVQFPALRPKFDAWSRDGASEQTKNPSAGQGESTAPAAAGADQFPALRELLNSKRSSEPSDGQGDGTGDASASNEKRGPVWRRLFDKNLNKK